MDDALAVGQEWHLPLATVVTELRRLLSGHVIDADADGAIRPSSPDWS
jgi:hypothetical protein